MNGRHDLDKMGLIYENILNEALPREFEFTGKAGERDEDANPEESPMMSASKKEVKFPGAKSLQASKFYLPYIKHFQNTYGVETGAAFADMIARLAERKLKEEHSGKFTGSEVDFRSKFLAPLLQDVVGELGVSKGANELTSGYIARALTDAFTDAGYLKSSKLAKPEDEEMGASEDEESHCHHAAEGCDCNGCEECRANQTTGGYMR